MVEKFDLLCIGSGPAGQRAAVQAAKLGKRALVIERGKIGGSSLHSGTIPSKTLREAALALQAGGKNLLPQVLRRLRHVLSSEQKVMHAQLTRNKVSFASGTARFLDAHTLEISSGAKARRVQSDFVVIATGTSPRRPTYIPFNGRSLVDTDELLKIKKLPRSLGVVGAGVIGCEYASIFRRLGVRVTLLDQRHELLRNLDAELVKVLQEDFGQAGITLSLGHELDSYGCDARSAWLKVGKRKQRFDLLLYCMGRSGNTRELNLAAAGLEADARGLLEANEHYQTRVPHIYAVGDVIGPPALAATSAEQGRRAAAHAFGLEDLGSEEFLPYGIYTIPEISTVGLHEEELRSKKIEYVIGIARYREMARGMILGDKNGFLKLLVHKRTHRILGVHALGTGATELVHIGQVAMALGADVEFFVRNVFNYPTLAEAYKVAALNARNQLR